MLERQSCLIWIEILFISIYLLLHLSFKVTEVVDINKTLIHSNTHNFKLMLFQKGLPLPPPCLAAVGATSSLINRTGGVGTLPATRCWKGVTLNFSFITASCNCFQLIIFNA